jgi:hypothetical protein
MKTTRGRQDPKATVNTSCPRCGNSFNINAPTLQDIECDTDWKSIHTKETYSQDLLRNKGRIELGITDISTAILY